MTTVSGQITTSRGSSVAPSYRAPRPLSRWLVAAMLVGGATLQLIEEMIEPPFADDRARFDWMAAHTTTHAIDVVIGLLAVPLLIGATLQLGQRAWRMPRLARVAVAFSVVGFCGLAAVHGFEGAEVAFLDGGVSAATTTTATASIQPALGMPLLAMFIGTLSIGLPLLMVALWRSRAVPRGAILLVSVFMVIDFAAPDMAFPSHAFSFIAFTWMAVAIVRDRRTPLPGQQ